MNKEQHISIKTLGIMASDGSLLMQVIGDSLSFAELMRRDFWGLPMHGFGTHSSQIGGALERASWRDICTFHMKIEKSVLLTHIDSELFRLRSGWTNKSFRPLTTLTFRQLDCTLGSVVGCFLNADAEDAEMISLSCPETSPLAGWMWVSMPQMPRLELLAAWLELLWLSCEELSFRYSPSSSTASRPRLPTS